MVCKVKECEFDFKDGEVMSNFNRRMKCLICIVVLGEGLRLEEVIYSRKINEEVKGNVGEKG